jgi:hypothetical protein
MSYPVPTSPPTSLRAGDTVTWRRTLPNFPASAGGTLSYVLVRTGNQILFSATADGDDYLVEVPATTTADWTTGKYTWLERITDAGKVYTLSTGVVEILPNLAAATGGLDTRTHAQKTLEALEAWIENKNIVAAEYQIGDRQIKSIPITELLKLRDLYRREVRQESGAPRSGRIYLRF